MVTISFGFLSGGVANLNNVNLYAVVKNRRKLEIFYARGLVLCETVGNSKLLTKQSGRRCQICRNAARAVFAVDAVL